MSSVMAMAAVLKRPAWLARDHASVVRSCSTFVEFMQRLRDDVNKLMIGIKKSLVDQILPKANDELIHMGRSARLAIPSTAWHAYWHNPAVTDTTVYDATEAVLIS